MIHRCKVSPLGHKKTPFLDGVFVEAENGSEQVGREFSEFGALAFGQLDVRRQRLPLHTVIAEDETVAARVDVGIVDLRRVADQHDLRAFSDARDDSLHFVRRELLRFIKRYRIQNVVFLTGDVHYCAANHYDPSRAKFTDFEPFWEFVAGPLNAGSFGPNALDDTFGPEAVFTKAPPTAGASPFAGYQFFGQVDIDQATCAMQVRLVDLDGNVVFEKVLEARR